MWPPLLPAELSLVDSGSVLHDAASRKPPTPELRAKVTSEATYLTPVLPPKPKGKKPPLKPAELSCKKSGAWRKGRQLGTRWCAHVCWVVLSAARRPR